MTEPFDIDLYIQEYSGKAAINRLITISTLPYAPEIRRKALLMAVDRVKADTLEVDLYFNLLNKLKSSSSPHDGNGAQPQRDAIFDSLDEDVEMDGEDADTAWVAEARTSSRREADKLEAEMRNYSVNLIKESIRANHARRCGDYDAAIKSLNKTREFNSNPQHELETSMAIIESALVSNATTHIMSAVAKAEYSLSRMATKSTSLAAGGVPVGGTGDGSQGGVNIALTGAQVRERDRKMAELDEITTKTTVKLRIAKGVALMTQGYSQWPAAAREFAGIEGRLEEWEGSVVASSDIAVYATLTGLASLGRSALKTLLADNNHMRYFMEFGGSTHTKTLLDFFLRGRYQELLSTLSTFHMQHASDYLLRPNLNGLEQAVLQNCLVQYFQPLQNAPFDRMAKAFGQEDASQQAVLRGHVADLVGTRRLSGKVDLVDLTLQSAVASDRSDMFQDAVESGRKVQQSNRKAMLRMQLIDGGLVIEAGKKQAKKKGGRK